MGVCEVRERENVYARVCVCGEREREYVSAVMGDSVGEKGRER
jgi:hypothetical protein